MKIHLNYQKKRKMNLKMKINLKKFQLKNRKWKKQKNKNFKKTLKKRINNHYLRVIYIHKNLRCWNDLTIYE